MILRTLIVVGCGCSPPSAEDSPLPESPSFVGVVPPSGELPFSPVELFSSVLSTISAENLYKSVLSSRTKLPSTGFPSLSTRENFPSASFTIVNSCSSAPVNMIEIMFCPLFSSFVILKTLLEYPSNLPTK